MTTQFVSYAEAGKRGMHPENLMKISSALGVSADYLLTGERVDIDYKMITSKLHHLWEAWLDPRRSTPQQLQSP